MNTRGSRHRMVIGSAAAENALFLLDCQLARLEPRKQGLRGEAVSEQPIRPASERAEQAGNGDWLVYFSVPEACISGVQARRRIW
jgi:hypothetical protein